MSGARNGIRNPYRCHLIGGAWIQGRGPRFASIDPASGKIVWEGCEAIPEEIDTAVEAAKRAFQDWGSQPLDSRIYHLHAFKSILSQAKELVAEAISKETGKPSWEAKTEVLAMVNKIGISIEAYSARCPEMIKEQAHGISITRHRPHGILAVLGPFNFPGHLPNGHIVPALLAGNTIVFKPSEKAPLAGEIVADCWKASGLPDGVLNLVQGGRSTGEYLAQHPGINGLLFTGSWAAGRQILEKFSKIPEKILALEMGGNNPLIVGDIADFKAAAYLTIQSAFLTAGQRCTCARRVIVPKGNQGDAFVNALKEMMQDIRVGAYAEMPEPFMGPVISVSALEALLRKQEELIASGGRPIVKMERLPREGAFLSPGLIDVTAIACRKDEEIFGPILQLVRVGDFKEAIEEANRTEYGLTAGLFSDSEEEYQQFYPAIKAGVVNWNTPLTGASSSAPFGGIKHSGNLRPSAFYAADYCAYPVASIEMQALKMPPNISPGIKQDSHGSQF